MKTLPDMQPVSYDQAFELVIKAAASPKMPAEHVELKNAVGRTLACEVNSDLDYPGADISAMDGYCLCAESLKGASSSKPVALPIKGGIDAGH
ncbi:MAG: hypothetical protein ACD_39C00902G0001, partial [uncultured bacterium]